RVASAPLLPKFGSEGAAMYHELRKRGTSLDWALAQSRIPRISPGQNPGYYLLMPPRFSQLTMDQLDAQQRALGEQIMKVSRVGLGGPYNSMLRSPVFSQRMFDLLAYLRWNTSVPLRLNELAILIVAREWRSQVEWFAHAPIAIKAGLSPQIVAELKTNQRPSQMPAEETAVYDLVTELIRTHAVSDATFARARQLFGEQQLVDLAAVAGTYLTLAMLLAIAEQSVPARAD